jgi:pSer/pThr/pTyr-binding forkhead associated (FHA) protein
MAQTLNLTFMNGARDGEIVQLETTGSPPSVSLGRTAPCELVLSDDPDMSRRHARIFWSGSTWMLEDLNSSNGTFIGEFQTQRKLSAPAAIKDGDIFRVGLTRLRLGGSENEHSAIAGAAAAVMPKRH